MGRLLGILIRSRGLLTFLLLQGVSLFLVVNHNDAQRTTWLETKSVYGSYFSDVVDRQFSFVDLAEENEALRQENAILLSRLPGSAYLQGVDTTSERDSLYQQRFTYLTSRIVNRSPYGPYNSVVIDRGSEAAVHRGQGVMAGGGPLGIVSEVTERYARVVSLLHQDTRISGGLGNNAFGTLRWDGRDPRRMTLTDVPDYISIAPNDTVFTTGYSNVFPTGVPIGLVESSTPLPGTGSQDLTVVLLHDPLLAADAYVVQDLFKAELDQLNQVK